MVPAELQILTSNTVIIVVAYFVVYPRFCGANLHKILFNDVIATLVALLVAGAKFAGGTEVFSLGVGAVNWFWFTLLSYFLLETPFMIWYFKRHGIWPGAGK
ncbi:MAG TPA: hypothetical protein PKE57_06095 [Cellvibrionaceae bacterium]|nr:hypothetical protein [Cellvibrionaceae bacterium]HMW49398.1 hypothetical protein [Cellvibrionaceae bacterium]HNG61885.1 hypothetical protein [Cellvibrionaceae bacterium]